MSTTTTYYDLVKPGVNDAADQDLWGYQLNDDLDVIDTALYSANYSEVVTKSSAYTVTTADQNILILADATSADFTITLPSAVSVGNGWGLSFKKTDATANIVTIDAAGSETIDSSATYQLTSQNQGVTITSDGANWLVQSTAAGVTSPGVIAIEQGGTGASTAAGARTNLGLGTMATQADSAVAITGGSIANVSISNATITGGSISGVSGIPIVTNSYNWKINFGTLTIQGGIATPPNDAGFNFPTSFSSTPYGLWTMTVTGSGISRVSSLTSTTANLIRAGSDTTYYWVAVGPT